MSKKKASTATEHKERGQQLALEHAGQPWAERALKALAEYCQLVRETDVSPPHFAMEEFRVWAVDCGLIEEPASINAWGGLPHLAVSRGLIGRTNTLRPCCRPESHGRLARLWLAL